MSRLTKDPKQYAKLLLSVSKPWRGIKQERPLDPFECAQMIKRLIDEEGDTKSQISTRIGMIGRTVNPSKNSNIARTNQFLALLNISEKSRCFAGWAWDGYPKIQFQALSIISSMDPEEQDIIIQSVYNNERKYVQLFKPGPRDYRKDIPPNPDELVDERRVDPYDRRRILTTHFARMIVGLKGCGLDILKSLIRDSLRIEPVDTTTHMIVCKIPENMENFISLNDDYENFISLNDDYAKKLFQILGKDLAGELYGVNIEFDTIVMSMDEEAYDSFCDMQQKRNLPLAEFIGDFFDARSP